MAGDRSYSAAVVARAPAAGLWISISALASAIGGLIVPAPSLSCFLTAALVGLAQGWMLRPLIGTWWTWFITTAITGGAGMALFRAQASLPEPGMVQFGMPVGADLLHNFAAGAIIGACQAFLLAARSGGTSLWILACAASASLFWTITLFLPASAHGAGHAFAALDPDRISSAAIHVIAWGGLALVTAFVFPRLEERK